MPNLTPEQLRERYQKLPPDVQEAYFGVETGEILQKIGKENRLTTEKIGIMADETGLLMLGLTHPNKFISNLAERMDIDKELAKKIAYKINEEIFKKIRESLRKIHKRKPTESEERNQTDKDKKEPIETRTIPKVIKPYSTFVEKTQKPSLDAEEGVKEKPEQPKTPEKPTSTKDYSETKKKIFEERKKVFRSSPTETVVPAKSESNQAGKKEEKETTTPIKPTYPEGVDPYREPID